MKPFFESIEQQTRLIEAVNSWLGTPFVAYSSKKKIGCDCVTFSHSVLFELGCVKPFVWPHYPLRCGGEEVFQLLCNSIESTSNVLKVNDIQVGDLLVFSTGKTIHHVGIALSQDRFCHCVSGYGVIASCLSDSTFSKRLRVIYRIMGDLK